MMQGAELRGNGTPPISIELRKYKYVLKGPPSWKQCKISVNC